MYKNGFTERPLKHDIARDEETASKLFGKYWPEKTENAKKAFVRRVRAHFSTDYDGARGLSILGRGRCPTHKLVEFIQYDETFSPEYELVVIALTEDGPEAFDREEALGYDAFVKAAGSRDLEAVKQELREKHLEQKRNEPCEE